MRLFGKTYTCQACGAKFNSEEELKEHAKTHVQSGQPMIFKCSTCGATFDTQNQLMTHLQQAPHKV